MLITEREDVSLLGCFCEQMDDAREEGRDDASEPEFSCAIALWYT